MSTRGTKIGVSFPAALVAAWQNGDSDALPSLAIWLYGNLPSCRDEDQVQDLLLRLCKRKKTNSTLVKDRPIEQIDRFVTRSLRFASIDRARSVEVRIAFDRKVVKNADRFIYFGDPARTVECRDALTRIASDLERLSAAEAEAVAVAINRANGKAIPSNAGGKRPQAEAKRLVANFRRAREKVWHCLGDI